MEIPAFDPLMQRLELPFEAAFHPLGFPLEIATNETAVLRAAEDSWGCFPRMFGEPPVRLHFLAGEEDAAECPPGPVFRAQRHLLAIVANRANFALCDGVRGFAFGWVTRAVARNRGYFRWHFLEAIGYALLVHKYVTPIHGACVARSGRGVLLCGAAGAGKSSVAMACAQRGWTFVSDDASYLLRKETGRVLIGRPQQIRFRDTAVGLFPELAGKSAALAVNGKPSIELRTADLPGVSTAFQCGAEHVVFLDRQAAGPARLRSLHPSEALRRLVSALPLYDENVYEEQKISLRRLLQAEALELCYADLDSAVNQLDSLVSQGGRLWS